jgi:hypothetical protein
VTQVPPEAPELLEHRYIHTLDRHLNLPVGPTK